MYAAVMLQCVSHGCH